MSWQWLYVVAGAVCVVLIVMALSVTYPASASPAAPAQARTGTIEAVKNPYVLGFSAGVFLYVGVEAAIYVWMPTLLASYRGDASWLAAYGISIFFALRAAGRFLGAWMLLRWKWHAAVAVLSGAILACFALSVAGGRGMGGVSAARFRSFHGRDLSDAQFERHQLRPESTSTAPRQASSSSSRASRR